MFNHFRTKSKLVTTGVIAFVAIALYAGLFLSTRRVTELLQARHAEANQARVEERSIEKMRKALVENAGAETRVSGYVLTAAEVVSFIEEVEGLAHHAGVNATTDAVSTAAVAGDTSGKWENLRVVISFTGNWADSYQFISLLEQLPYKAEVIRAVVERGKTDKNDGSNVKVTEPAWRGEVTLQVLKRKGQ